jgi:superfamily II DNA or RNA helicase
VTRTSVFSLRPYQREALDALREKWKTEDGNRWTIILPTGGGKTVCFAHLAMEHLAEHPGERVLVLVHTDELVTQAATKLREIAPHLSCGIVKAARNEVRADVIVASVQSLRNAKRRDAIRHVGLVIIDECHHAVAATYMQIMEHYGCFGGRTLVAGFTATLTRGDKKALGTVWQGVAFSREISWMVRKRYLVPPKGKAVAVPDLNLRAVKSTKADYREGALGEALAESLAPELVAKAYLEHAATRRGILFAPTVASAEVFAEAFRAQGITCELVHGALDDATRHAVLARHRSGLTQVVANCMVLTEGYDDPEVSCIVVARPTKSKGLYIQMVGRGLRVNPDPTVPYEDQDCLILDVVGASALHDLRSIADLSEKAITEKEAHSGKTLIDLEDAFDAGEGADPDEPVWWTGDVETRDFDPLGQPSTKVWIKTTAGSFFVPAGKHAYVFIAQYPEPGRWSVFWCAKEPYGNLHVCEGGIPRVTCDNKAHSVARPVGMTEHAGLPLDQAMVWAEDLAVDMGADTMNLANKKAPWRRKPPSEALIRMARGLGVKLTVTRDAASGLVTVTDKAGEVSDRVTKIVGSRRIDPLVGKIRAQMNGGGK